MHFPRFLKFVHASLRVVSADSSPAACSFAVTFAFRSLCAADSSLSFLSFFTHLIGFSECVVVGFSAPAAAPLLPEPTPCDPCAAVRPAPTDKIMAAIAKTTHRFFIFVPLRNVDVADLESATTPVSPLSHNLVPMSTLRRIPAANALADHSVRLWRASAPPATSSQVVHHAASLACQEERINQQLS